MSNLSPSPGCATSPLASPVSPPLFVASFVVNYAPRSTAFPWRITEADSTAQLLFQCFPEPGGSFPLAALGWELAPPLLRCLQQCLWHNRTLSFSPGWSTALPDMTLILSPQPNPDASQSGSLSSLGARTQVTGHLYSHSVLYHGLGTGGSGGLVGGLGSQRVSNFSSLKFVAEMALAIAAAPTADRALSLALECICQFTGWHYGEVWLPQADQTLASSAPILTCSPIWHSHDPLYWQQFRQVSLQTTFVQGEGLPGRVWQAQQPEWIRDVGLNSPAFFLRANITKITGLRSGLGVPILGDGQVLAVMVFFMLDQRQEDEDLVALVSTLATHIGSVVQRKQVQMILHTSEARLQSLFASLPGFVFRRSVTDLGVMQYLSQGCLELTGYEPEVLMARISAGDQPAYQQIVHPDDRPLIAATIQGVLGSKDCYVVEYRIRTVQGQERWFWEKGCCCFADQGEVVNLEGFITDISDRKQAELTLQNQQAFLHLVLDTIPQAVFWKDRQSVYLGGNRQWLQDVGLANSDAVQGKTDGDFHPPAVAQQYVANDQRVMATETPLLHQVRSYRRSDGQIIYKDTSKVPLYDAAQNLLGILGTYEDITERRQAELALVQRERYMATIVQVQTLLLNLATNPIAHHQILQSLGQVSGADRAYWVEVQWDDDYNPVMDPQGLWVAAAVGENAALGDALDLPDLALPPLSRPTCPLEWDAVAQQICSLVQGQPINCAVVDLIAEGVIRPGQSAWQPGEIQAILLLPLMVHGQFFGFLGFENHREPTPWPEAEVHILQAAALSVALMQEHNQALKSLGKAEAKYRSIFENAVEGIFQSTPEGNYCTVNPMLANLYGYDSPEELVAQVQDVGAQLYVNPEDRQMFVAQMQRDGLVRGFEAPVRRKDGQVIWISEYARAIHDDRGQIVGYEGTVQDITDRKQAEDNLRNRDRLLQGLAQATQCLLTNPEIAVAMPMVLQVLGEATDADRVYLYQNHPHPRTHEPAMTLRYEWCAPDIAPSISQPHWQNLPYSSFGLDRWYQQFEAGQIVSGSVKDFPLPEQTLLSRDQILKILMVPVFVDEGLWGYIGFDDCRGDKDWNTGEATILTTLAASLGVALKRQETEQTMEYQAFHDDLTALPNRVFFNQSLPLALEQARQRQELVAVMFLDLDRFKTINDSLGHAIGDRLLQQATSRILSVLRKTDVIARWGGDEFTLYLPDIQSPAQVSTCCRRLLEVLRPSIFIDHHELHISASIGIALYPQDGADAAILLSHADMAMYRVKEQGRNHFQFFQGGMNSQASKELILEQDLHQALKHHQFHLCYQPRVDAQTGEILQMETLLRWTHPKSGVVSPGTFIKLAEANGLMVPIGEWVLRSACAQAQRWNAMGFGVRVAVNLSPRQFRDTQLVTTIRQILAETGLDPVCLELEITESMVMADTKFTVAVLQELEEMGVRLALDDFGTGYSALSCLKQFPLHTLKIDQSFVQGLPGDPKDMAIVSTIIALGQGLGLQVVAEGVETPDQLRCLQTLGCEELQGFLLSPGLLAAEATQLLRETEGYLPLATEMLDQA
ncbi:EAL domain-containing protein [Prochlorothrix hollandica]|uniref:EAL domain-containing protein n=1 Tax=Prochlorothrix hollandica TaxID=1223 RepID=UPI003341A280